MFLNFFLNLENEKMKRITFRVLLNINKIEKNDRIISEKSVDYHDQCFSQESIEHEDTETDDE